jgi:hypothetical protein
MKLVSRDQLFVRIVIGYLQGALLHAQALTHSMNQFYGKSTFHLSELPGRLYISGPSNVTARSKAVNRLSYRLRKLSRRSSKHIFGDQITLIIAIKWVPRAEISPREVTDHS